jgi:dihydroorotase
MDIKDRNSHPRSAGTFSRILGHYVRETGTLSLPDAIRKMSLMPARRLEGFVAGMREKGRLQVGADADIVVFDATRVAARATYGDAKQYSQGFEYVMVNGQFVVQQGQLVRNVYPGRPVHSDYWQQKQ